MRINKINTFIPQNINSHQAKTISNEPIQTSAENISDRVDYSQIPFCAINNIKPKKLLNIILEKTKLLNEITELLETQPIEKDTEDIISQKIFNHIKSLRAKINRIKELTRRLDEISGDTRLNIQQKFSSINEVKKEFNRLKKGKPAQQQPKQKPADEKTDFQLLNMFKTSIENDDYRLKKVFDRYYERLNDIKTIEELNKIYPKIKTPQAPQNVIAAKIEKGFNKQFYDEFAKLYEANPEDGVKFANDKIIETLLELEKKFGMDAETLYEKLAEPIHKAIATRYSLNLREGFNTASAQPKSSISQISDVDIKMLKVDFDDFVLSTIKKQYLELEKPANIIYSDGEVTIPLKTLSQSNYKFEKVPENVLSMIRSGEAMHQSQRNYELFDMEKLQTRLSYYAGTEIGNNEKLLEKILDFHTCSEKDAPELRKFLHELDEVFDERKTVDQALETIEQNNITPRETHKLNELEKQKALDEFKIEQQKALELNKLRTSFDDAINKLYAYDLNNLALTCSQYSPRNLEANSVENTKFLINLIDSHIKDNKLLNPKKLETDITNWHTFNYYQADPANETILQSAIKYAKDFPGENPRIKAGQYIMNSEIIEMYPESSEIVKFPELLTKIVQKSPSKDDAVKYLCKFSDFQGLESGERSYLSTILKHFDIKDPADKIIIKHIIEEDYAKVETRGLIKLDASGEATAPTAFCPKAKQEIIDKYKFPTCIDYLQAFEDAINSVAGEKGTTGIKYTAKNKKTYKYKYEVKIMGHDDRLFSSNNDYNFDIFSERGFH